MYIRKVGEIHLFSHQIFPFPNYLSPSRNLPQKSLSLYLSLSLSLSRVAKAGRAAAARGQAAARARRRDGRRPAMGHGRPAEQGEGSYLESISFLPCWILKFYWFSREFLSYQVYI